jgi:hypothetical protein
VTPEYPQGTYAYFVTIDDKLQPAFPYTIGVTYYGTVPAGNTGPGSGHNTISESVVTYTPNAEVAPQQILSVKCSVFPNPSASVASFEIMPRDVNNFDVRLFDQAGRIVYTQHNAQPSIVYSINVTSLSSGTYYLRFEAGQYRTTKKLVVAK